MIWITKEQIIEFQEKLIRKTGGSFGLRDEGGLESCIYSPLQSFDGKEFYSSIIDKAFEAVERRIENSFSISF